MKKAVILSFLLLPLLQTFLEFSMWYCFCEKCPVEPAWPSPSYDIQRCCSARRFSLRSARWMFTVRSVSFVAQLTRCHFLHKRQGRGFKSDPIISNFDRRSGPTAQSIEQAIDFFTRLVQSRSLVLFLTHSLRKQVFPVYVLMLQEFNCLV